MFSYSRFLVVLSLMITLLAFYVQLTYAEKPAKKYYGKLEELFKERMGEKCDKAMADKIAESAERYRRDTMHGNRKLVADVAAVFGLESNELKAAMVTKTTVWIRANQDTGGRLYEMKDIAGGIVNCVKHDPTKAEGEMLEKSWEAYQQLCKGCKKQLISNLQIITGLPKQDIATMAASFYEW